MSSVTDRGIAPCRGTLRCVGLKPTTPHSAAGARIDPTVSDPIAAVAIPSATETAAPDEDPPGIRLRSHGFPGVPKCGLMPTIEKANCAMFVRPTRTAPAAFNRRTTGEIFRGRRRVVERLGAGERRLSFDVEHILDGNRNAGDGRRCVAGLHQIVLRRRRRARFVGPQLREGSFALTGRVENTVETGLGHIEAPLHSRKEGVGEPGNFRNRRSRRRRGTGLA